MSKFNQPSSVQSKTTNLAGGEAFVESPKMQFISMILTSFVQDQFYRSANKGMKEMVDLVNSIADKKFLAQGAVYSRNEFGLRSITHIVAGELAHIVKGQPWSQGFYSKVVRRPDDMTEILSYYLNTYGKPIPNSLKRGLAKAFDKFDKYQLSKYRSEGKSLSLIDVVNLVHPTPTDKNASALKELVEGKLVSTDTWEAKLTKAGQEAKTDKEKAEKKEEAWKDLIINKKIGYFALLRNLRNIVEQAPDLIDQALDLLVDEKMIRKSLVLPFRFDTAFKALRDVGTNRKVIEAVGDAMDISCNNIPRFEGKSLIVIDGSASMTWTYEHNAQGTTNRPVAHIGSLFAAMLYKANPDSDLMIFSNDAKYFNIDGRNSILSIAQDIMNTMEGGGTNFHSPFEQASKPYDRIIILSDMQGWIGYHTPNKTFAAYKDRHKCNPHLYSFDLAGYGTLMFPEKNVYTIAGVSEKIFDVMKLLEQDRNALIKKIESIKL